MENPPAYRTHERCLISEQADLRPLRGYERHYLVRSRGSGFVFCSRIPTQRELINHYETYSRDDYASPWTIKRYHELLDEFEQYRTGNRILDVGSGIGLFLQEAKERGWEVHGTEFTDEARAICEEKDIAMHEGKLDPANYKGEHFDVVTYFEVLEHINNPLEEIANICEILRVGGVLYLTTPNFNAIERYVLREKYSIIGYPEHLCYYTPRTLDYLLTRFGLERVRLETTGVSLTRLRNSMGLTKQPLISESSDDEVLRSALETNQSTRLAKKLANKSLSLFGVGNSLKGLYVKVSR